MIIPKNILVPTDFSSITDLALKEAIDFAQKYKSHVHLLHVIENDIQQCTVDYCIPEEEMMRLRAEMIKGARARLKAEITKLKKSKNISVTADVRIGDPFSEILKEQHQKNIDLVIAGTHKRKGLKKFFHNGLTEKLARNEDVATLIMH